LGPTRFELLNFALINPSAPGANGSFGVSGMVQPQLALTFTITNGFFPVFLNRNETSNCSPSVILPKSRCMLSSHSIVVKFAESLNVSSFTDPWEIETFLSVLLHAAIESKLIKTTNVLFIFRILTPVSAGLQM